MGMALPTVKAAREYVGRFSDPSKMPGLSVGSTSAKDCITGSKLRKVKGSVCEDCYAMKGRYPMDVVQNALDRRRDALDKPDWVPNMVKGINDNEWVRWHDSGDLQSLEHLEKIAKVAELTPKSNHWLPTREVKFVSQYLRKHGEFPENLCVRVSSAMVDGIPLARFRNTSTVHRDSKPVGWGCPASSQGGKCDGPTLKCRACWNKDVPNVGYPKH